ncbi:MAG: aminotransferase class I/II-fold pyridoxal phosphate-dependent enzyme, partial [Alphaproteobacteria bacterium]|nr:aminotransferase class I/II-fold pyridoxal phosphate-dependent enzyme [Alphaproteobacteria bacterium]
MKVSQRSHIPSFEVMKVFKEANRLEAAGKRILHLSVGQPGNMPPKKVLERGQKLLDAEKWGYTDAGGTGTLKKRIAEHYHDNEGLTVDYKRIFVTVGSSSAFSTAVHAAFDQGDAVAMVEPC